MVINAFSFMSIVSALRAWRSKRHWLFSVKVFGAAMSALYIALALGLDHPYWAMATVYLVSNPLDGATRSKSAYRVAGTVLGAVAAVVLVPPLVNEPLALMAAISFWTATLLYLSYMQRGPRSYVFLLAAFTLPIVALPTVTDPTAVFDIALVRVEETVIGIVCASLVASLVFPARVASVLCAQSQTWLDDSAMWIDDMVSGVAQNVTRHSSRQKLTADLGAIEQLINHLSYEAGNLTTVASARALHSRMTMLLPVLSALAQAVSALRATRDGMPRALAMRIAALDTRVTVEARVAQHDSSVPSCVDTSGHSGADRWYADLVTTAERHLDTLADLWHDCQTLQQRIGNDKVKGTTPSLRYRVESTTRIYHHDHMLLLFQAASAGLAIFCVGGFWILSGWENGAGAVGIAASTISLLSAVDQPRRVALRFVGWSAFCLLVVWFYLFTVLPWAHDFEMLVALLAIPFVVVGALIARPGFNLYAVLLSVNAVSFANAQTLFDVHFDDLFNTSLAIFAGMSFAPLWFVMTRPFGQHIAANRLIRANWRDIAHGVDQGGWVASALLRARMFDRLARLVPMLSNGQEAPSYDGFVGVQVGFDTLALQRDAADMAPPTRRAVQRVLSALAIYSRRRKSRGSPTEAPRALAARIDAACHSLAVAATPGAREAVAALVGLRLTLFPNTRPGDTAQACDAR
ncbi:FUSC family protein [Paraburkholderia fungorum]|uniref:FUSC family protein n=1 Tax=Paraburkholderia fungorum TaxID=134537 RepID=UPI0038B785EC